MGSRSAVILGAMNDTTPTNRARQDKRREAPFSFRPTNGRRDEFLRRVAESGMSANAFLNQAVFSRGTKANSVALADALSALAAIKDELRRHAGETPDAEALYAEIVRVRTLLMRGLGRRA